MFFKTAEERGFELLVPRQIGNSFVALSETGPSVRRARRSQPSICPPGREIGVRIGCLESHRLHPPDDSAARHRMSIENELIGHFAISYLVTHQHQMALGKRPFSLSHFSAPRPQCSTERALPALGDNASLPLAKAASNKIRNSTIAPCAS
jgi:hypothetical protein